MGVVMIRCPVTGHTISTGLQASEFSFNRSSVFFGRTFCPICRRDHQWFAKNAWVCESKEEHGFKGNIGEMQAARRFH